MTLEQAQYYTLDGIIEELYLCLMKEKDDLYHKQAYALIYLVPIERPTPVFEIKISDLNEDIQNELDSRWDRKEELDHILREAVGKIFRTINERYFLLSVKRLLRVRLIL